VRARRNDASAEAAQPADRADPGVREHPLGWIKTRLNNRRCRYRGWPQRLDFRVERGGLQLLPELYPPAVAPMP